MWYVYILRCKDETLYTGITNDLTARIQAHNAGTGAKYTRGRGPVSLVYTETYPSHPEALRRDYAIKQLSKQQKLSLIQGSTSSTDTPTQNL